MRRFLTAFVTAAIVAIIPAMALCGNQEVAEQIANRLRKSGKMSNYKIGVKYQDGTAWLQGRVASPEQKSLASGVSGFHRRSGC
jgi:osmotically-inducible protein OsmY